MNGFGEPGGAVFFENREIVAKGYEVEERERMERKRKAVVEKLRLLADAQEGGTVVPEQSFVRRMTGEDIG